MERPAGRLARLGVGHVTQSWSPCRLARLLERPLAIQGKYTRTFLFFLPSVERRAKGTANSQRHGQGNVDAQDLLELLLGPQMSGFQDGLGFWRPAAPSSRARDEWGMAERKMSSDTSDGKPQGGFWECDQRRICILDASWGTDHSEELNLGPTLAPNGDLRMNCRLTFVELGQGSPLHNAPRSDHCRK